MAGRPRTHLPLDKTCAFCGAPFHANTRYAIQHQRFCSAACGQAAQKGTVRKPRTMRACKKCGKMMSLKPHQLSTKFFCSYECGNSFTKAGEGNPAWRGGIGNNGQYWKRKARERDGFHCRFQACAQMGEGKHIHAHHRIPRNVGGTDDLDNLITLCARHHREVEGLLLKRVEVEHPQWVRTALQEIYAETCPPPQPLPSSGPPVVSATPTPECPHEVPDAAFPQGQHQHPRESQDAQD